MEPNTVMEVFAGLDFKVMIAFAFVAGILHGSKLPMLWCIGIPMLGGAAFGYLLAADDATGAELFSAILLNGIGAVVIGRVSSPIVVKILNLEAFDPKPPSV